jgi:hypothetical protein
MTRVQAFLFVPFSSHVLSAGQQNTINITWSLSYAPSWRPRIAQPARENRGLFYVQKMKNALCTFWLFPVNKLPI